MECPASEDTVRSPYSANYSHGVRTARARRPMRPLRGQGVTVPDKKTHTARTGCITPADTAPTTHLPTLLPLLPLLPLPLLPLPPLLPTLPLLPILPLPPARPTPGRGLATLVLGSEQGSEGVRPPADGHSTKALTACLGTKVVTPPQSPAGRGEATSHSQLLAPQGR